MERLGCSFTGHRSIAAEHRDSLGPLVARSIAYAYGEGCRDFFCGGALGFDTVAAREVVRFRLYHPDVRLVLLLPCTNQDEHWSSRERDAYNHLLSTADEVEYISDAYRDGCMRDRNLRLAEKCSILIAYCSRYNSGAGQTVRLAERLGRRVYNLWPTLSGISSDAPK